MACKVREFRGLIYSNYDSEADFARALNWTRQRLHKISNGIRLPDLQEIDEMAKPLKVEPNALMKIFLDHKSPNEQQHAS